MKNFSYSKLAVSLFLLIVAGAVTWVLDLNSENYQTASVNVPVNADDKNFACNPFSKWKDPVWCKEYGGTYESHKLEAVRHQGIVVIYKVEKADGTEGFYTNPTGERKLDKKSGLFTKNKAVCPQGSVMNYHASSHLKFSPSKRGMYDGEQHYWCEKDGVAVNPILAK